MPSRIRQQSSNGALLAERVQAILAAKRLTLYQVSRRSELLYGRSSPYFIPHNLYHELRGGSFTPSIHQSFAFGRISSYRSRDWLRVFGFDLEDITRAQLRMSRKRTLLLDPSLTDLKDWVTWFRNRPGSNSLPLIAPLGQLLELTPPRRIDSLTKPRRQHFLYAKIGREDAYAFPELVPGSIVRVRSADGENLPLPRNGKISDRIFLVEHNRGFCCCRVRAIEKGVIMPVSSQLSYAQVEFEHPREARILGVVDLEIRPLVDTEEPIVPKDLARRWKPRPLAVEGRFGQLLRRARTRMNLSLRQASALSCTMGEILKDQRYAVSSSSLYEYEALHTAPRDFHKVMTLCSVYGLPFLSFLETMELLPEDDGAESIPDNLIPRGPVTMLAENTAEGQTILAGFLEQLLEECQEVPFFLRDSMGGFGHAANVSLNDFFWVGGQTEVLHPYLTNGLLALVNRRRRTAVHLTSRPVWEQPVYIIQKRVETYLATCCGLENGNLVIHPYTSDFHRPTQFRQHQDAEVVGQILAVARKLE